MELTHHAYLYEGEPALAEVVARRVREEEHIPAHSPALVVRVYEKFGVDDARALKDIANLKGEEDKVFFIVAVSAMTSESQQALLKLFEEPGKGVVFILIAPPGMLLPTLLSRCLPLPFSVDAGNSFEARARVFLKSGFKERAADITLLLKEKSGDERARARSFLSALEAILYSQLHGKGGVEVRKGLEEIAKLRPYLSDRAPSLKMIFEHLAAALPRISS